MLSDTVTAGLAAGLGSVTVVTPDQRVAAAVRALGATVHPDPTEAGPIDRSPAAGGTGPEYADGLNSALASAAAAVRERHGAVDLLALQADLPAVHADELAAALTAAPGAGRAVVVDHTGRGTAALIVRAGAGDAGALMPRFGPDSARRHRESGAVDLEGQWPGLRLDVDTADDLDRAVSLGVGAATAALLTDIGWPGGVHEKLIRRCVTPSHVC